MRRSSRPLLFIPVEEPHPRSKWWRIIREKRFYDNLMISVTSIERYFSNPREFKQVILQNDNLKLYLDSGGYTERTGLSINLKLNKNLYGYLRRKCMTVLKFAKECSAHAFFSYDIPITNNTPPSAYKKIQRLNEMAARFMLDKKPPNTKLFAVVHGWDFNSILSVAERFKDLSFDGLAVPSPISHPSSIKKKIEFACAVASVADDLEIHYLGAAGIIDLYIIALLGINSCDSKAYSDHARFRKYIIPQTGQRIAIGFDNKTEKRFRLKRLPCMCPACYQAKIFVYSHGLKYESDFYARKGSEAGAMLSLHNLYTLFNELNFINEAMHSRELFRKLLMNRMKVNPLLRTALKILVALCEEKKKLKSRVIFFNLLKNMV